MLTLIAPQVLGAYFFVGCTSIDSYLTLDVTYFLELIGITQAFDITCAVISVNLATTWLTYYLIEVRINHFYMLTTGGWSSYFACSWNNCHYCHLSSRRHLWILSSYQQGRTVGDCRCRILLVYFLGTALIQDNI